MNKLIAFCEKTTRAAGRLLLKQTVQIKNHKTANDLLTENDLKIEKFIVDRISARFPEVNIVSEESNADKALRGISVVIDPIDGTCNYAVGSDRFGVQLAIFDENVCCAAIIYLPRRDELICAIKGQGTYINGKRIFVSQSTPSSDGMLLISDYYSSIQIPMDVQFELVKNLQADFLKTRHLGAACEDFSSLAKGQGLAYICYYNYIWDIAPGLLIASECGYCYAAIDGGEYRYGDAGLVVANNEKTLKMITDKYKSIC